MAGTENRVTQTSSAAPAGMAARMASVKRTVVFLLVACLAVSVSFNLFLACENWLARTHIEELSAHSAHRTQLLSLLRNLTMDLQYLSRADQSVKALLNKYYRPLRDNNLLQ